MKRNGILVMLAAAGLGALSLGATEVGVYLDKAPSKDLSIEKGPLSSYAKVDLERKAFNGFGIRGAFTVADLKAGEVAVTGDLHLRSHSKTHIGTNETEEKASHESFSIGGQVSWNTLVDLTCGVEMRLEKITTDKAIIVSEVRQNTARFYSLNADSGSTMITRPWIRAGIGYTLPMEVVSPFIRLEAAYALKSYDLPLHDADGDTFRRALAPKSQFVLVAGIKF